MLHFFGFFVVYNVLAFLTQPLTGWWADCMEQRHWLLLLSVAFLTLGVLTVSLLNAPLSANYPVIAVVASIFLGMGNSLFHVWGGKQVAIRTNNDIRALGVFVSTGAFGLAVSMVFFSWTVLFTFLLLICLFSLLYLRLETINELIEESASRFDHPSPFIPHPSSLILLLLIMAFVMLRSFMGSSFSSGLGKTGTLILLVGFCGMLGKMAGGWVAQWMGNISTFVVALLVAVGCWLLGGTRQAIPLVGLLAINCTMPVTLYWANGLLKGREGLAFGLLAAALIPGYLLSMLSV
jgi:predicted MFS family arabinose efflux permease